MGFRVEQSPTGYQVGFEFPDGTWVGSYVTKDMRADQVARELKDFIKRLEMVDGQYFRNHKSA
jgi:hypothetical protein